MNANNDGMTYVVKMPSHLSMGGSIAADIGFSIVTIKLQCTLTMGVNTGSPTFGSAGFLMSASLAPVVSIIKDGKTVFKLGGQGGGIEVNATIYYRVSQTPCQSCMHNVDGLS